MYVNAKCYIFTWIKLIIYKFLLLKILLICFAGPVYLELYLENLSCKNISSSVTISNEVNINSIKVFALNDSQQAFILSGPENQSVYILLTYARQFKKF
jgi:hypothetical protein